MITYCKQLHRNYRRNHFCDCTSKPHRYNVHRWRIETDPIDTTFPCSLLHLFHSDSRSIHHISFRLARTDRRPFHWCWRRSRCLADRSECRRVGIFGMLKNIVIIVMQCHLIISCQLTTLRLIASVDAIHDHITFVVRRYAVGLVENILAAAKLSIIAVGRWAWLKLILALLAVLLVVAHPQRRDAFALGTAKHSAWAWHDGAVTIGICSRKEKLTS